MAKMENRYFYMKDIGCVVTVEYATRKEMLEWIADYVKNPNPDETYMVMYTDGSSDYINEEYDGHHIKRQNIVSILNCNPSTYVVYGHFGMNEAGCAYPAVEDKIDDTNIIEVDCENYVEEAIDGNFLEKISIDNEEKVEIMGKTNNFKFTKKRINALKRIISKQPNFLGKSVIQTENAQYFGNGYMFVKLGESCCINPLTDFFDHVENGDFFRKFEETANFATGQIGEKLELPKLQELAEIKKFCQAVDFGEKLPLINADFLKTALEILVKDEYGNIAYIMGKYKPKYHVNAYWENTLQPTLKNTKQEFVCQIRMLRCLNVVQKLLEKANLTLFVKA